ncbi:DUF2975 domain-containing protein [Peribacillus huizhouensis]|uniref:Uncharacterized protein n=1 Tax=Peribacillus huizhouensis TaxID=1501239 RepID=A0ABR6CTT5_9BACI|nr:DUF2975 domain-containing protein [Peribacillus huizhouensis]MBA9028420.1 hypothetical protein [Peribacillus huizhouensis]
MEPESVVPFFVALYPHLNFQDTLTELSVKYLKNIKFCALTISGLYVVIMSFVYLVAELDDAPDLIIIGMAPSLN